MPTRPKMICRIVELNGVEDPFGFRPCDMAQDFFFSSVLLLENET